MRKFDEKMYLTKLIKESINCYISACNNICYSSAAPLEYFYMVCKELGLKIKCNNSYSYEATKKDCKYCIEWIEHDFIIAFEQVGVRKDFVYKNNNNVLIKLHIDSTYIITDDIFKNIKDMIQNDKLLIFEDNSGIKACDDYIYNTNYQMNNIQFIPTYVEEENQKEKIIECDIFMNVIQNPDMKVRHYTKTLHEDMKKIFEAATN